MNDSQVSIGVIGGSGLYNMPQLTEIEERSMDTPFGKPSDVVVIGSLNGTRVAFIPRHGRGHIYNPTEVNYRANIFALKSLGVEWVISVSACGSLREEYEPGHIVIPDQLFDHTKDERGRTFFQDGFVAHVSVADPFSATLSKLIADGVREAGGTVHEGGTFITIEGPRFSTKGESHSFRAWGMSIIGMTTSPEAYLAREAEMAYAVMAHVTDYDVWHESEEAVTVDRVVATFQKNIEIARSAIVHIVEKLGSGDYQNDQQDALAHAILTNRDKLSPETIQKLTPIVGKYFAD
ncbi:MAG: S-methyl-5'-thioadenosine phosphorylase [Chloroflexi bacterium]|nr:S-methyl-5'-thioadenosine phosphorylase [Chloroflexota bacterium]